MSSRYGFYSNEDEGDEDEYHNGDTHEEPSSLTRASFVIPCTRRKSPFVAVEIAESSQASSSRSFSRIERYEKTDAPRLARSTAYHEQVQRLNRAVERTCHDIFAPLAKALQPRLQAATDQDAPQYYFPGCDDVETPRLKVTALVGPPISAEQLHRHLQQWYQEAAPGPLITLAARECTSLSQVLRLISARTEGASTSASLATKRLVTIRLLNSERIAASVLNDILQALHSLHADADSNALPRYAVLVDAASGAMILDEKFYPDTLPLLDLRRLTICASPVRAFEVFIQESFLPQSSDSNVQIRPCPPTMGILRRLYFERGTSLDTLVEAIKVYLCNHFGSLPESAFTTTAKALTQEDFASDTFLRIRDSACSDESFVARSMDENSEQPSALPRLQRLLTDDGAIFEELQAAKASERHRTGRFVALVTSLYAVRSWLSGSGDPGATEIPPTDQHHYMGPRGSELGGIVFALLSGKSVRTLLHDLPVTLRRRNIGELEALWLRLRTLDTLRLSKKHIMVAEVFERVLDHAVPSDEEDVDAAEKAPSQSAPINSLNGIENDSDDAAARAEQTRLKRIQQQLQREENAANLKKEVAEKLLACLEDILPPQDPFEAALYVFDNSAHLEMLLNPVPRANIIAALSDAPAYTQVLADAVDGENTGIRHRPLPDICHAFQTYSDAGRLINLADWYTAFEQSLEAESAGSTSAAIATGVSTRKRQYEEMNQDTAPEVGTGNGEGAAQEDDDDDDEIQHNDGHGSAQTEAQATSATARSSQMWRQQPDIIQVRFALAAHELGRMGFLKRTRRKRDHVLKLVYDLPSRKVRGRAAGR